MVGLVCLCSTCLGPQLKDEKAGGLTSPAGLTEAGESVSQMAHTQGRQVGAAYWCRPPFPPVRASP